jgi:hypothetical protein
MVGAETAATTGAAEPGGGGHLHLPPSGVTPLFAELSKIKSVIGIKYPKMKLFLGGRSMRSRQRGNGFLLMPPEFAGLYKKEENILRRPWHDKMKRPIDVNSPVKFLL